MGASTVDCRQGCAPLQTSQAVHQSLGGNPQAGGIRETQVWLPSAALQPIVVSVWARQGKSMSCHARPLILHV